MTSWLTSETEPSKPTKVREMLITPFFHSVMINLPGVPTFFVWKRPVSILISDSHQNETVLPIQDVTRNIILGVLASSILFWLITSKGRK
jgi:hypothetical protein